MKKLAQSVPAFALLFGPLVAWAQGVADTYTIPNPLQTDSIAGFVSIILGVVVKISGIFAVFFLIYSGFQYVLASGNPEKVSSAHRTFLYTVIGIAILLGAAVLARVICGTIEQLGTFGPSLNCAAITAGI